MIFSSSSARSQQLLLALVLLFSPFNVFPSEIICSNIFLKKASPLVEKKDKQHVPFPYQLHFLSLGVEDFDCFCFNEDYLCLLFSLSKAACSRKSADKFHRWATLPKAQRQIKEFAEMQRPQDPLGIFLPAVRPDTGHKPSRLTLGYGYEGSQHFIHLAFRLAYHDLLDPEEGYTPGAQIEFLDTALRYNVREHEAEFERLKLIDIVSLSPRDLFIKPLSWKLNLGTIRQRLAAKETALVTDFNGGLGLTYQLLGGAFIFGFLEGSIRFSDRLAPLYAIGTGPSIGVIKDLSHRWRIKLSARSQQFFLGDTHSAYEVNFEQRINLSKQSALRFRLSQRQEINYSFLQGDIAYQWYF
jgi:hypothetical protein